MRAEGHDGCLQLLLCIMIFTFNTNDAAWVYSLSFCGRPNRYSSSGLRSYCQRKEDHTSIVLCYVASALKDARNRARSTTQQLERGGSTTRSRRCKCMQHVWLIRQGYLDAICRHIQIVLSRPASNKRTNPVHSSLRPFPSLASSLL